MPEDDGSLESKVDRRAFLGVAGGILIIPRHVLGGSGFRAPSDRLSIAGIGVGGQGAHDLKEFEEENIVALCDVDDRRAAPTFKHYPKARRYRDFRVMLEKEKGIEAVVVATPDHTHAVAAMAAIRHGKHVYCEKPLTRTVFEARRLAEAVEASKVASQMGNQRMGCEGNCLLEEWIQDGAIGPVHEVHVWSDRPTHNGSLMWAQGVERPMDRPPPPDGLDWDLWLGPAAFRPYHPAYVPFFWRGWWDFGSGGLGDMGSHNLAPVFAALKLGPPVSVDSSSTLANQETLPLASTVHYEFPARKDMPAVKLHWYDGGLLPARPSELEDERDLPREDGILFVGEKGRILVDGWGGHSPRLIPEVRMQEYRRPPKSMPRSAGHYEEWVLACKTGSPTRSGFGFAGPLTEALLLGTISVRLGGRHLRWDSVNLRCSNEPQAEALLHYQYRPGWEL
jgi:predicted dehydrogenase